MQIKIFTCRGFKEVQINSFKELAIIAKQYERKKERVRR